MSTFQLIVLGIFGALLLIGVGVFATLSGLGGGSGVGPVTVWGTVDERTMSTIFTRGEGNDDILYNVTYVYKDPATYTEELLNAMASGRSPDLFLIPMEDLHAFSDKIIPIPYRVFSQSAFLSAYVDGAQLFLTPQGALALPFSIDPLVMYWNRDLFAGAGVANPPVYWNDFITLSPKITSLDTTATAKRATVGMGEWRNVNHAKEILISLFMQAGDDLVVRGANGSPTSVFTKATGATTAGAAESVLRFYTEFANPSKTTYSWNRSLPAANDMFAAGDVAVYFGFISEIRSLSSRNPNLRFGVAPMPQIEGNITRYVYGRIHGFAVSRTARNPNGAAMVAQKLTGQGVVAAALGVTGLPPVRRDISFDTSANAAAGVAAAAALIARDFLDPNPQQTSFIFGAMIESVISGAKTPAEAVRDGAKELSLLLE